MPCISEWSNLTESKMSDSNGNKNQILLGKVNYFLIYSELIDNLYENDCNTFNLWPKHLAVAKVLIDNKNTIPKEICPKMWKC